MLYYDALNFTISARQNETAEYFKQDKSSASSMWAMRLVSILMSITQSLNY